MKTLVYNPKTKFSSASIQFGGRLDGQNFKVVLSVGDKITVTNDEYKILETDDGFNASVKQGSIIVTSEPDKSTTPKEAPVDNPTDSSKTTSRKKQ